MSVDVTKIEGIRELNRKFSKLTDKQAVRELNIILLRVAKPIRKAARDEAPVRTDNLKKSIAIFKGKSKTYPNVQVGARSGSKYKYDGYYAYYVHEGTKKGIKANKFFDRAEKIAGKQAVMMFETEYTKRLKKKFG